MPPCPCQSNDIFAVCCSVCRVQSSQSSLL
ncbi:MAG: SEC-C domain-containing protein [Candidatus Riflebacteria bacterium]|nr:SEC-C domain-containing protein [Candidatus Riflebacteria bacterium]